MSCYRGQAKRAMMNMYCSPECYSIYRIWPRNDQGKHSDQGYINYQDNVAYLMDCEVKVKVKYGWLHSRAYAKMYACAKYHWLWDQ